MRLTSVGKWLLIAVAMIAAVQTASAEGGCKCGADTREYQILRSEESTKVRVWVVNYCRYPQYLLVSVVATATDDGGTLKSDYPVRVNPRQRFFVDVPFNEDITIVNYWYATRLGASRGPI